jgi:hypothetical protein
MASRDSNIDHVAVKRYRDFCRLTPNWLQRKQIVLTVDWGGRELKSTSRALDIWEGVLKQFMLEGNNPKRVDWIMDRFEERVRTASVLHHHVR